MKSSFRLGLAGILIASLSVPFAASPASRDGFDVWVDQLATDWNRDPTAPATPPARPVDPPAAGVAPDNDEPDQLPGEGIQARRERRLKLARDGLEQLTRYPAASLTPSQRVSAAMLRWQLERVVTAQQFEDFSNLGLFDQRRGLHVATVDSLTERARLRRPADVERYLERLARVPLQLDEGLALARASAARGFIQPTYILQQMKVQLQMFLEPSVERNVYVTALEQRTKAMEELSPEARAQALVRARQLVADKVRPAYVRVLAFIDEFLPRSTPEAGRSRLPNGAAAYAEDLRYYTTTTLRAEEIHAIGLREVARLEAAAEPLLRQLGQSEGKFTERLARASTGSPVPDGPDPRAAVLARYTEIIRDAEKRSASLFNLKPRAPVEVRRVPPLTERVSSAYYTVPPADGSRPGIFWLPMPGTVFFFGARMRSLAYHEAVPGHHFQLALQQEQKDLPRFRARRTFGGISAHSEGWGLYAERLAVEQGWYQGDPFGELGALGSELFRARRLVVDTGLHAKGWTRQQAIDYGISASEVERYIVNPGQACSYFIGMLRILELRERARAALGSRFSLPDFHDVILTTGTVPLEVLGQVIEEWVAARP